MVSYAATDLNMSLKQGWLSVFMVSCAYAVSHAHFVLKRLARSHLNPDGFPHRSET